MTYAEAKCWAGKYTNCRRSPKMQGTPPSSLCLVDEDDMGWHSNKGRRPDDVLYEYALGVGCPSRGFAGSAAWTYWRVMRRRRPGIIVAVPLDGGPVRVILPGEDG